MKRFFCLSAYTSYLSNIKQNKDTQIINLTNREVSSRENRVTNVPILTTESKFEIKITLFKFIEVCLFVCYFCNFFLFIFPFLNKLLNL